MEGTLLMLPTKGVPHGSHTCWVEEALEDDDITINLVGGGDG